MTRTALAACLLLVALVGAAGCTQRSDGVAQTPPIDVASADLSGSGPGSVVEAKTIPNIDREIRKLGGQAARVVYRSTSGIDGQPTEVSGAVFVPVGKPPAGGWPVIAFAHGTSGINPACGPSQSPDLFGASGLIAKYLDLGFAVAAADYQGLGHPGAHPYLDAKTAGLNVIDSVRALRKVFHGISEAWAVFGGSQGGGAAWAANEQAATYATELDLVGSVSLVPAADISGFAAAAADGSLSKDQQAAYIWVLMGLERSYPDFNIDDYRRGIVKDNWDVLSACSGPEAERRAAILADVPADDLRPATPEAERRLAEILQQMALPQQRAAAPMQIYYGGEDTYINPEWTAAAISRACAMGDTIEAFFQEDRGHGDIDGSAYLGWLGERFQDMPAPNTCGAG
ncbi:MAG: lipase family protein [Mycobacterium sp.]